VVERLDVKIDLLRRVAERLAPKAILTTNTSGLSIDAIAACLPAEMRPRFFGTHFFNPPRYMYLLELVPGADTDEAVLLDFQRFAEQRLGKGVVRGKDTPNFVANRIFVFTTVYAAHAMERHGLSVEDVDAVTGKALARATTFGTSDLAGVDVLAHAVRTHYEGTPEDECRDLMQLPAWIVAMVERGTVGLKAGAGFYKDKHSLVIDPGSLEYRPRKEPSFASLGAATKTTDPGARVAALVAADDAAGTFAWDVTATTLVYAARRVGEIADELPSIDTALRWGMGWELGPFELWDAIGLSASVRRMTAEGRDVPLWVLGLAAGPAPSFYVRDGGSTLVWDVQVARHVPLVARPWAISLTEAKRSGHTIFENDDASLVDLGDRVACLEFHTKANVVNEGVLAFIEETLERAGSDYDALVIGNQGTMFSAGADLAAMLDRAKRQDWTAIDGTLRHAQSVMMALKYAPVPIVAASFGKVLGGGLELCLHTRRMQAAHETSMGLVETTVGVIPGAGGSKEILLRAMAAAGLRQADLPVLRRAFEIIAMAKTSGSAWEAFDLLFLRPGDGVTMNRDGLLHAAKQSALALLACGWQPLAPVRFEAAGRDGLGNLRMLLHNLRQGDRIDAGTVIDEAYLLDIERAAFVDLCHEPLTQERMAHVLQTGKPLRN
jgi:3-hydroxyacyl-CoA dehydrogenase